MKADELKETAKKTPDGATLTGEDSCAAEQGSEFEREMQREIDRLRRLVNEGLSGIERKLKNRHAS